MGERCNFVFATEPTEGKTLDQVLADKPVVLYSHWGGYDAGAALANALKAATPRWDDEGYGTRIMVSRIIGEDWNSETGYGLYAGELCDNSYPVLVVDFPAKLVRCFGGSNKSWTFPEFVALGDTASDAVKRRADDEDG